MPTEMIGLDGGNRKLEVRFQMTEGGRWKYDSKLFMFEKKNGD